MIVEPWDNAPSAVAAMLLNRSPCPKQSLHTLVPLLVLRLFDGGVNRDESDHVVLRNQVPISRRDAHIEEHVLGEKTRGLGMLVRAMSNVRPQVFFGTGGK